MMIACWRGAFTDFAPKWVKRAARAVIFEGEYFTFHRI
jgi:hypothetical protein